MQTLGVASALRSLPGHVAPKQQVWHSALLQQRRTSGEAGLGPLAGQKMPRLPCCTPKMISMSRVLPEPFASWSLQVREEGSTVSWQWWQGGKSCQASCTTCWNQCAVFSTLR